MGLIGATANEFGLNPRTLRYYERLRLLPAPVRTPSGYRVYDERTGQRLAFIMKAKGLGLSLAEIRQIIVLRAGGNRPCASVRQMLRDHVLRADRQIAQLQSLRRDLTSMLKTWETVPSHNDAAAVCPKIEAYQRPARRRAAARKGGHAA